MGPCLDIGHLPEMGPHGFFPDYRCKCTRALLKAWQNPCDMGSHPHVLRPSLFLYPKPPFPVPRRCSPPSSLPAVLSYRSMFNPECSNGDTTLAVKTNSYANCDLL